MTVRAGPPRGTSIHRSRFSNSGASRPGWLGPVSPTPIMEIPGRCRAALPASVRSLTLRVVSKFIWRLNVTVDASQNHVRYGRAIIAVPSGATMPSIHTSDVPPTKVSAAVVAYVASTVMSSGHTRTIGQRCRTKIGTLTIPA